MQHDETVIEDDEPTADVSAHPDDTRGDADEPEPVATETGGDDGEVNRYQVVLWEGLLDPGEGIFEYGTCLHVERELEKVIDTPPGTNVIDVWLQSSGGSADEAYRYMLLFREYAATVRVVVGRHAKSAATLMLIGADDIFMGAGSELGPLDAQVYSDELDKRISALDIARSIEELAQQALSIALSGGGAVVGVTGIPRREVLPSILTFTANFFEPMVAKMDPAAVYRAANQLRIASDYADRLLEMRTEQMDDMVARELVYRLVNDYPDHGFIISRHEAETLGLPVHPIVEYEDVDAFHALTTALQDRGTVALVMEDVVAAVASMPAGDEEDSKDTPVDGAANDGEDGENVEVEEVETQEGTPDAEEHDDRPAPAPPTMGVNSDDTA